MMQPTIPILVPLTGEARGSAPGDSLIHIARFPFRVGRESRHREIAGINFASDQRREQVAPNNDLYLVDRGRTLSVSREHFQIERDDQGHFIVRDRGSACGTLVGNRALGLGGRSWCQLHPDNTIVVGGSESAFVFRFDLVHRIDLLNEKPQVAYLDLRRASAGASRSRHGYDARLKLHFETWR